MSEDEGSSIILFVVMLLSMTLVATASVTLAKTHFEWSQFGRRTSNSYHLARSGAEKVVDSMNKEIARVLPNLIEEASQNAHSALMAIGGVKYAKHEGADIYEGNYVGTAYENQYETELRQAIYNHIVKQFIIDDNNHKVKNINQYEASKSDAKGPDQPIEIQVNTTIYKEDSPVSARETELRAIVRGLAKDAFAVEVTARAGETKSARRTSTISRVVGTIHLDQFNSDEELLEEYEWAEAFPEALQSAVLSFGDFVKQGGGKVTINGDLSVKGTAKPKVTQENAKAGTYPEADEAGGVVISDGGILEVTGNALVINNIQIGKDAIANTIAINGHYSDTQNPWDNPVNDNYITIGRNVFMDNEGYNTTQYGSDDSYIDDFELKLRRFDQLINMDAFKRPDANEKDVDQYQNHTWSRNNPIEVITSIGETSIDISAYKKEPTAIISTDPDSVITLKARGGIGNRTFKGVIITAGKVKIEDSMTIDGIVIAGNEQVSAGVTSREDIRKGNFAGVQVAHGAQVTFNYDVTKEKDRNILFEIRFLDKSLQRKLYDCLKVTNYGSGETDIDIILGASEIGGKPKVKLSHESVIRSEQDGLRFVMKSLKKI